MEARPVQGNVRIHMVGRLRATGEPRDITRGFFVPGGLFPAARSAPVPIIVLGGTARITSLSCRSPGVMALTPPGCDAGRRLG
jgi:hypothetical protein